MARLSRSELKGIVKECLVEILQEGLDTKSLNVRDTHLTESNKRQPDISKSVRRKSALDNIEWGGQKDKRKELSANAELAANSMTEDPVLASILKDTALTTMQEQAGADRKGPGGMYTASAASGDNAARIAANNDPTELFSESANNWAALAFPDPASKG